MGRAAFTTLALALAVGLGATPAIAEGALGLRGPAVAVVGQRGVEVISIAASARPPVLVASAGTVGVLGPGADGRLIAEYRPPAQGAPQVAMIGALDPDTGELLDWIAIPLDAEAQVAVRVDRAADVVLAVAGSIQGPFHLPAVVENVVPVRVPPGVTDAEMTAVDLAGRSTRRSLPLGVPALARVLVVCPRAGDHVTIVIANADGSPGDEAALTVRAADGALAPARRVGPGVYQVGLVAEPGPESRAIELTAAIGSATPARCTVTIAAAPPIEVVVAPPPPPPPPPPAPPRPAPPRRRSRALVAVHAGYLTNFARVAAPTVGAEVASLVPVRHLHAGLAISYYASTGSATTADGEAITISVRAVPVLARLVVDVGPVFVGATAGAILGRTSLSSMSTGRSDERLIRPAVGVVAGGALGLGRGQLAIEVGYLHATAVGAASGAVAGYSLTGGYRLAL